MQLAEVRELQDVDHALLVELEHREEAHDDLEAVSMHRRPGPGSSSAPTRGSRRSTDSTASRTLTRTGAMWSVSTTTAGGAAQRRAARRRAARRADPLERVGHQAAVGLLGAGGAGHAALGAAHAGLERRGRVLERLALEQAGEEQVALLEAEQLLVELGVVEAGEQAAGLELHERGRDEQELGGDVEVERRPCGRAR